MFLTFEKEVHIQQDKKEDMKNFIKFKLKFINSKVIINKFKRNETDWLK